MRPRKQRAELSAEPGYQASHAAFAQRFAQRLARVEPGACFEVTLGGYWVAYNPHGERTHDTRGHWLDPRSGIVEEMDPDCEAPTLALFGPDGGCTMSGLDAHHGALAALFGPDGNG
jgi:hypothetical protein